MRRDAGAVAQKIYAVFAVHRRFYYHGGRGTSSHGHGVNKQYCCGGRTTLSDRNFFSRLAKRPQKNSGTFGAGFWSFFKGGLAVQLQPGTPPPCLDTLKQKSANNGNKIRPREPPPSAKAPEWEKYLGGAGSLCSPNAKITPTPNIKICHKSKYQVQMTRVGKLDVWPDAFDKDLVWQQRIVFLIEIRFYTPPLDPNSMPCPNQCPTPILIAQYLQLVTGTFSFGEFNKGKGIVCWLFFLHRSHAKCHLYCHFQSSCHQVSRSLHQVWFVGVIHCPSLVCEQEGVIFVWPMLKQPPPPLNRNPGITPP